MYTYFIYLYKYIMCIYSVLPHMSWFSRWSLDWIHYHDVAYCIFPCFIFIFFFFFCQLMSQLTTGAGEGWGARFMTAFTTRSLTREELDVINVLKTSLGQADPRPLWKQNNRSIDARTKWNRTLGHIYIYIWIRYSYRQKYAYIYIHKKRKKQMYI